MTPSVYSDLISTLQVAISPVILISGVGLLLLTMTNRLGRSIDRAREIKTGEKPSTNARVQIEILFKRAHMLRWAILYATVSALCSGALIILLFLTLMTKRVLPWAVCLLFISSIGALIVSLLFFLNDVNQSLDALKKELAS